MMYRTARILAKAGVALIAICSLIGVLLIAVTQYRPFRQWAIQQGLNSVNSILQGKLTVDDIDGDLLRGMTLHGVQLEAGDSTFAYVPEIDLEYDIVPALRDNNVIASAILHSPRISLIRNDAGVWNFTQIVKPSTDSIDTEHSPLAWIFDVKSIELIDGVVVVNDRTRSTEDSEPGVVDFLKTTYSDVSLDVGTYFSEDRQNFNIRHLSFNLPDPDLRLVNLEGNVSIDEEDGLSVEDLAIETGRSYVTLDGRIETKRLFDPEFASSITDEPFHIRFSANPVSTGELRKIIPDFDMFGGDVRVDLEANGRYQDFTVEPFRLRLDRSTISGTAHLVNIADPDAYQIEAHLDPSSISYSDIPRHLPGIDLSQVSFLTDVQIETLTYSGRPNDAVATFDVATPVGHAVGGAEIDFASATMPWRVDAALYEFNPAPVLGNEEFEGRINARVVAEGIGFDPNDMIAAIRARLDQSDFAGRHLTSGWVQGSLSKGGRLTVDTVLAAFGQSGSANHVSDPDLDPLMERLVALRSRAGVTDFMNRISLSPGEATYFDSYPSVRASGWINGLQRTPSYRGFIETDRLNIADITLDKSQQSRIGLLMEFEGSGIDPDDMDGMASMHVYDLSLPSGENIKPFDATVELRREGDERRLSLVSDVIDAKLVGKWRFASIVPTLASGFERLAEYVSRKRDYRSDNLASFLTNEGAIEPIFAQYEFIPKDLSAIEAFLPNSSLRLDASLRGEISGTTELLGVTARGEINSFSYDNNGQNILVEGVTIDADIRNITASSMDALLDADITISADSVVRFGETRVLLPSPLKLDFEDGELSLRGAGVINDEYNVAIDGKLNVNANQGYEFTADTLIFGLTNGLRWRNVEPVDLLLNEQGATINRLVFERRGAERIEVTGRFNNYERFDNVDVHLSGLGLDQLGPFLTDPTSEDMFASFKGAVDSVSLVLNGTLDGPELSGTLKLGKLQYSSTIIGDLNLDFAYADRNLTGSLLINRSDSTRGILASISINSLPIDLAFAGRDERFLTDRPFDISGSTNELPLAIISPFVPGISIHGGTTTLGFSVSGTYPDLKFYGDGSIKSGRLTLETTNVTYMVDGKFNFNEKMIDIPGIHLRNLPTDYSKGEAFASGTIGLNAFVPDKFNINIRMPNGLLVLNDGTQIVNESYFGDLVIGTSGSETLRFTGTYADPQLTGSIDVLSSDLKLPYGESAPSISDRVSFINYEDVKDQDSTSSPFITADEREAIGVPDVEQIQKNQQPLGGDLNGAIDGANRQLAHRDTSLTEYVGEQTFMDRLAINLSIGIPDDARITTELGTLQQLYLVIDDGGEPLDFTMKGDDIGLDGQVRLLQGSKFTFVKTFEATGTVNFEESIDSISFNITGIYEGRSITDNSGSAENYQVLVKITGTRTAPLLEFDYTINGITPNDDPQNRRRDAVSLLLFGKRFDNVDFGGDKATDNIGSTVAQSGSEIAFTTVGNLLNSVFSGIEQVQNIDVQIGNPSDPGTTKIRLDTKIGDFILRYGGRVNALSDGTFTIELPLSLLLDYKKLNKFALEFEREVIDQLEAQVGHGSINSTEGEVFRLRLSFRSTF